MSTDDSKWAPASHELGEIVTRLLRAAGVDALADESQDIIVLECQILLEDLVEILPATQIDVCDCCLAPLAELGIL